MDFPPHLDQGARICIQGNHKFYGLLKAFWPLKQKKSLFEAPAYFLANLGLTRAHLADKALPDILISWGGHREVERVDLME